MPIQLVLALTVFCLIAVHGLASNAAPTCENIFAAKPTATALTRREKLFQLSKAVAVTPIDQRPTLRHEVYTESADDVLRELQALEEASAEATTPKRQAELQFAHAFITHLRGETEKQKRHGNVPADWAFRLGLHASNVATLLKAGVILEIGYFRYGVDAYLDPAGTTSSQAEALADVFEMFDKSVSAQPHKGIIQIPTTQLFRMEGVVRLLAVGIHPVGMLTEDDRPSAYFRHDFFHDAGIINAILFASGIRPVPAIPSIDITESPVYLRFKNRLQKLIDEVDTMAPADRHAGFAYLFYLIHENPDAFISDFTERTIDISRMQIIMRVTQDDARVLLKNPNDMGFEFLPKIWPRDGAADLNKAEEVAKRGAAAVLQALVTVTAQAGF